MSLILPNLYLSSVVYSKDDYFLNKHLIKNILIVGSGLDRCFPNKIKYKQVMILDKPDTQIIEYFKECHSYIDEVLTANKPILVHCYGGQSRSVTIVISYVMAKMNLSFQDSYNFVKQKHPRCEPNKGFIFQLKCWEEMLSSQKTELLQV